MSIPKSFRHELKKGTYLEHFTKHVSPILGGPCSQSAYRCNKDSCHIEPTSHKLKKLTPLLEMGKKAAYYAVAKGHKTGVFTSWDTCKSQVAGFSNARYKKFSTPQEAQAFVDGGGTGNTGSYGSGSRDSGSGSRYSSSGSYRSHTVGSYGVSKPKKSPKNAIYIDGASRGNGKSGVPNSGFGVYFGRGDARNRGVGLHEVDNIKEVKPTNQRAELHALKYALQHAKDNKSPEGYNIFTDSMYTKNCIEKWSDLWEKNGWKNSSGASVANQDLIKPSVEMYRELKSYYGDKLTLNHVKGHLGDEGNEAADQLANRGADSMASHNNEKI